MNEIVSVTMYKGVMETNENKKMEKDKWVRVVPWPK